VFLAEISGQLNSAGQYLLARRQNEPGNSVSGLVAGNTSFNLGLLPKRCMQRNSPRVRAGLHLQDDTYITFQNLDQNSRVASKLSATQVVERLSELVSSFGPMPFLPIRMEFVAPPPDDFLRLVEANPTGRIPFERELYGQRVPLAGFIDQAIVNLGTREATNWSLICSPSVDLGRLT
jgi:hypothetical protein